MHLDFGYIPFEYGTDAGDIRVAPIGNRDAEIAELAAGGLVERDWVYAPAQGKVRSGSVVHAPYRVRVFSLPQTHRLIHSTSQDPGRLRFLVRCYGFLMGMYTSEHEGGYIDAAPVRQRVLNDIVWIGSSLRRAVTCVDKFYDDHVGQPRVCDLVLGVIQSLFLAQRPNLLSFERFIYLYTAFEGAYKVGESVFGLPAKSSHSTRIKRLCDACGIPLPWWVSGPLIHMVNIRNATFHEGLFIDGPFGYKTFHDLATVADDDAAEAAQDAESLTDWRKVVPHLPMLMRNLGCRFVVALLGVPAASYTSSDLGSRQAQPVRLT